MKQKDLFTTFLLAWLFLSFTAFMKGGKGNGPAKSVSDFSLKNVDGKMLSLRDYPGAKGFIVIFTCNHCPFAKLYPDRMNKLNDKYRPLGFPLIAINAGSAAIMEEDSYDNMIQRAKEKDYHFPYLYDEKQAVTRAFGASHTPHAFVLLKEDDRWSVKYNGAIDDNGADENAVQHHYVADAVDALLAGKAVTVAETKSVGCAISWKK